MAPPCGITEPLQWVWRRYSNKSGMREKGYVVDLLDEAGQFIQLLSLWVNIQSVT